MAIRKKKNDFSKDWVMIYNPGPESQADGYV